MKTDRPNRFQYSEKYTNHEDLFANAKNVQMGEEEVFSNTPSIEEVLKKGWHILSKLFIALKYQLFKRTQTQSQTQSSVNLKLSNYFNISWIKLGFLALAAFVIFKKDFSFSINMKSPNGMIVDQENDGTVQMGKMQTNFAQGISLKEEIKNPFHDLSTDNDQIKTTKAYIRRFQKVAQSESKKYGFPASIKMGQAILESNTGQNALSKSNNNHFSIKCYSKNCKKGHCSNFSKESHKDFYIKFSSAWESWRAHSLMMTKAPYKSLLQYGKDYKSWAYGLNDLGYTKSSDYPQKLISVIEKYQLYHLDK